MMNPPGASTLAEGLSDNQKTALLKLLGDDDAAVRQVVRDKILSYGAEAIEWLRPHTLSREPCIRRRAREIVLYFDRQKADDHFLGFCLKHGEECDLEEGAWLLALSEHPDINVEGYRALLDSYAADLRERLGTGSQPEHLLAGVNQYLFREMGFAGNEENYYDPENSYLNRVMDRRTGNPINLSLLYILVARRLRLPVAGIGLPGHFICRYQSSAAEMYIDPFHQGRLLTKADCVSYLLKGNYSVSDDYLTPVSPRRMLLRICANLHQVYVHLDQQESATRMQRYMVALAR